MNQLITCPLWVWIASATAIAVIAFLAGWALHNSHIKIKEESEPLPEGWDSWKV